MPESTLEVKNLHGHYGQSHVLQNVEFALAAQSVAIIGRNGMGKTTLCLAIMGLLDSARGSVRFNGVELMGRAPHEIAAAGIGYVPQGRRLFSSLTVDEHLRLAVGFSRRKGEWNVQRVYDVFPQLAARKSSGGGQLSGGEQQMLAIARALVTGPKLLLMDEPSEGLAPIIIRELVEAIQTLVKGGMGLLIVEQNLGVATALAERQLVMATGRIVAETTGKALMNDPSAQRLYLGIGPSDPVAE